MSDRNVIIADYGIGNLLSVARAIGKVGGNPIISRDDNLIRKAERLILPGVGAFGDCIRAFTDCGFDEPVRQFVATGRPLLGLCVGMQILFDGSDEFGQHKGMGLIPGEVKAIPKRSPDGALLKTPHIGWTDLEVVSEHNATVWNDGFLAGIPVGTPMYFVHSYTACPQSAGHRYADATYGGHLICAAVKRDNICGTQFHPEKSGPAGLALLANFLAQ